MTSHVTNSRTRLIQSSSQRDGRKGYESDSVVYPDDLEKL